MKKYLGLGAACAIAVASMTGLGTSAAMAAPAGVQDVHADTWQSEMLAGVNAERSAHGVAAVEGSEEIAAVAQARAEESAAAGAPIEDEEYANQLPAGAVAHAEITGAATDDGVASFLSQWAEDPEDSVTMSDAAFDSAGFGIAQGEDGNWYAVQVFAGYGDVPGDAGTDEEAGTDDGAEDADSGASEQFEDQSTVSGVGYDGDAETPGPEAQQLAPQAAVAPQASASWNQDLLNRVNNLRAQNGAGNLNLSRDMNGVAQAWAEQMAASQSMTHNPNYASQIPSGARGHSENIAWNTYSSSAETFFGQWVDSPAHFSAMVDARFDNVGFGMAQGANGWYAVQVFGEYGKVLDGGQDDPGTEDPGTEDPGTEDPGTEDPGTEDPGTEDPGTEDPGTEDPGTEDPGTEDPGTEDPGTEDPGTEDPGTEDPGTDAAPTPQIDLPNEVDAVELASGIEAKLSGFAGVAEVSAVLTSGGEELSRQTVEIAEDGSGALEVRAYQTAEQAPVPAGTEFELIIDGDGMDEPFVHGFTVIGDVTGSNDQPAPPKDSVVKTAASTSGSGSGQPQLANTGASDMTLLGAAAALVVLGGMALMLGGRRRA